MKHAILAGTSFLLALLLLLSSLATSVTAQQVPPRPLSHADPAALCAELRTSLLPQGQPGGVLDIFLGDIAPPTSDPKTPQQLFYCLLYGGLFYQSAGNLDEALEVFYAASALLDSDDLSALNSTPDLYWALAFIIGSNLISQGRTAAGVAELTYALDLADPAATPSPWTSAELRTLALATTHNNLGIALSAAEFRGQSLSLDASASITTHFASALNLLQDVTAGAAALPNEAPIGEERRPRILGGNGGAGGGILKRLRDRANAGSGAIEDANGEMDTLIAHLFDRLVGRLTTNLALSIEPLVLNNLGEVYRRHGQLAQAEEYFGRGLARIETLRAQNSTAPSPVASPDMLNAAEGILRNNWGLLYIDQQDYDAAAQSFTDALRLLTAREQELFTLSIHSNLGWLRQQQGRQAQAQGEAERAQSLFQEAATHYEDALALLETERAAVERIVTNFTTASDVGALDVLNTGGVLNQQADLYAQAMALYVQQGEPEKAFAVAERGRARLFLDMLATGQFVVPDEALLTELQAAETSVRMLTRALAQLEAHEQPRPLLQRRIEQRRIEAEADYAAALAALETQHPQLAAMLPGTDLTVDIETLQNEVLPADTTLVVYYTNDDTLTKTTGIHAVVWVIERESSTMVELETSDLDLGRAIDFMRLSIASQSTDVETSQQLYEQLFAPIAEHITNDKLMIVPHRALHYLPFAALQNAESGQYLLETYTLSYAPSASALRFIQENQNPQGGQVLVMGNPDYSLPFATEEANTIAEAYGVNAWTGAAASERTLRRQITGTDIIHLAAHGILSDTAPLESRIELTTAKPISPTVAATDTVDAASTDGPLTVRDIFELDLADANLVVLSACNTALGENGRGDELVGLTRAFLYAGTPQIITTLWSIDDRASTDLMIAFHENLRSGLPSAEALRQAQLDTQKIPGRTHPYYWAAFVLHGDAGLASATAAASTAD